MSSNPMSGLGQGGPRPMQLSAVSGAASAANSRGYAHGYAHGWAAGVRAANERAEKDAQEQVALAATDRAAVNQRADRAMEVLAAAARAAEQRTVPVLEQARDVLVVGAVEIAEAILGAELSDHGVAVRAALGRALMLEDPERVVQVRLNPADLEALRQAGTDIVVPDEVELVADPTLAPGDAISELPEGMLDARIKQAVIRVREELGLPLSRTGGERR